MWKLYDRTIVKKENLLFSNHDLFVLLLPIVLEQLLNSFMGMADTMMVSNVGSAAISAISLVDSINNLVIQIFAALTTGAAKLVPSKVLCPDWASTPLTNPSPRGDNPVGMSPCAESSCWSEATE